jgi:hypothetical protein
MSNDNGKSRKMINRILILALTLVACAPDPPKRHWFPEQYAAASEQPPYSCRLLYDEQKKCAFGSCDKRTVERLRNECLRDGGRP